MLSSCLCWIGGKRTMRKYILPLIDYDMNYVEVFGGAAWILFGKKKSKVEILNDINENLMNMYLQIKYHSNEVIRELETMPNTRELFNIMSKRFTPLTDMQRAAWFYYIVKNSFGAVSVTYATSFVRPSPSNYRRFDNISDISKRLSNVLVESVGWEECISKYDDSNALFYLDPPYSEGRQYAEFGIKRFDNDEHSKLADTLRNIKGNFILSYNDCEFVRNLYKGFAIQSTDVLSGIENRKRFRKKDRRGELIIMSRGIDKQKCLKI